MGSYRTHKSRQLDAFSVLEMLVGLALFALVAGVLLSLLVKYVQLGKHEGRRDHQFEALLAGERMAAELEQAYRIDRVEPTRITFSKLDPSQALSRLDPNRDATDLWEPYADTYLRRVSYFLDNQTLRRTSVAGDSTAVTVPLAEQVRSLDFSRDAGVIRIELTVPRPGSPKVFEFMVIDRW